jgi:PAS domain S-box-containing protein
MIQPLIWSEYFLDGANALNSAWIIVLLHSGNYTVVPKGRIFFVFLSQIAIYCSSTVMWIYWKRFPKFMQRIAIHKRNSDRFRALADSIQDAIIEADSTWHIMYVNRRALELFGFEDEYSFIGDTKIFDLFTIQSALKVPTSFDQTHKVIEMVGLRADKTEFPAEVVFTSYRIGDKLRHSAVVHSIAKRKNLEHILDNGTVS